VRREQRSRAALNAPQRSSATKIKSWTPAERS
jgi:hypothetical protein